MPDDRPLQQKLIQSLKDLSENTSYGERLTSIIDHLNKTTIIIPEDDYNNVINFVLVLMKSMPDLLVDNPNDQALKELCLQCSNRLKLLAEIQAKASKFSGK